MATSSNYVLTIQLALDGLSFALFDTINHKLVAWESKLSKLISDSNLDAVTLIVNERTNILVPEALYQPDDNNKLLSFGFNTPKDAVIQADILKKHKAVNVFAYSPELVDKLKAKWPDAKITHSSSVFLESLPESEHATVYVNVRNRNFDVAIMKDRLLFFNNFQFNDKNDFVYFLLNVLEQNKLSGQDTTVYFSGLILPSSEIIDLSSHYVKDIRFVEKPDALQVNDELADVPYQYYHIHYQAIK